MAEEEKDHAEEEEEEEEEARHDGGRAEALAAERAREARGRAVKSHDGDEMKSAHDAAHLAAHPDSHHKYTILEHAGIAATGVGITAGILTRDSIKAFFTSLWHTGKAFVTGKDSAGLHGWKPKPAKHGSAGHAVAHGGGGHKEHREEHHDEGHGKGHEKDHGGGAKEHGAHH